MKIIMRRDSEIFYSENLRIGNAVRRCLSNRNLYFYLKTVSDATGRSVVVEYIGGRMIVTETPAVTNHYLSPGEKYGVGNPESLIRFEGLAEKRGSIAGATDMRQAMEAVSYDGITRWSIVYNRKENTLDFCWDRNFDHPHTFSFGK